MLRRNKWSLSRSQFPSTVKLSYKKVANRRRKETPAAISDVLAVSDSAILIVEFIMAEEFIDFTQSSRRILLNPIVPLSMLDIVCRTGERAQATLLGKVYPSHIEIIEVIPMQFA